MGTPGHVRFFTSGFTTLLVAVEMFYDGYPSGLGLQLVEFLTRHALTDGGFPCDSLESVVQGKTVFESPPSPATLWSNGVPHAAAQWITEMSIKYEGRSCYIAESDTEAGDLRYTYDVSCDEKQNFLVRAEAGTQKMEGSVADFQLWCSTFVDAREIKE